MLHRSEKLDHFRQKKSSLLKYLVLQRKNMALFKNIAITQQKEVVSQT
jgi:hypothetical protein